MPTPRTGGESATAATLGRIVAPPCSVFRRHLRQVGLKYTTERAGILHAVVDADGPFDAERLIAELRVRGLRASKATVYRTLKLLVEAGILAERPDARDCVRYESIHGRPPANVELCLPDGRRTVLHDPRIERIVAELCRGAGAAPERHVLIVECAGSGRSRSRR